MEHVEKGPCIFIYVFLSMTVRFPRDRIEWECTLYSMSTGCMKQQVVGENAFGRLGREQSGRDELSLVSNRMNKRVNRLWRSSLVCGIPIKSVSGTKERLRFTKYSQVRLSCNREPWVDSSLRTTAVRIKDRAHNSVLSVKSHTIKRR
jgi:hypothetical protein